MKFYDVFYRIASDCTTVTLDDVTIEILLGYLDTIADFVAYLEKKEKLIETGLLLAAAGEEDLLSFYLEKLNEKGEHDFVISQDFDGILIDEGFWEHFLQSPQRRAQQKANQVSYAWDELINEFSRHAMNGTQYILTGLQEAEKVLRIMAGEPRTRRRMLSKSIFGLMEKYPKTYKATRVVLSSKPGDPYYVFLLLPHLEAKSQEEYREIRRKLLEAYCMVTKLKFPDAIDIVGIATESGTGLYRSEDALYLDASDWTAEQESEARILQEELGLLQEVTGFAFKEYEFPIQSKSARRRQQLIRKGKI